MTLICILFFILSFFLKVFLIFLLILNNLSLIYICVKIFINIFFLYFLYIRLSTDIRIYRYVKLGITLE